MAGAREALAGAGYRNRHTNARNYKP
jgi:hypothetical protein